jgi:hypothetical protein
MSAGPVRLGLGSATSADIYQKHWIATNPAEPALIDLVFFVYWQLLAILPASRFRYRLAVHRWIRPATESPPVTRSWVVTVPGPADVGALLAKRRAGWLPRRMSARLRPLVGLTPSGNISGYFKAGNNTKVALPLGSGEELDPVMHCSEIAGRVVSTQVSRWNPPVFQQLRGDFD